MKVAVILSGSGVYDGSEIQESLFTLLAISENKGTYECFAPDKKQFHVINHLTGEVTNEERNVLVESARVARGKVQNITSLNVNEFEGLVIPGGYGVAKNLNEWAISGHESEIDSSISKVINEFYDAKKPIVALCISPTLIAQALKNKTKVSLTVGNTKDKNAEGIKAVQKGIESLGAEIIEKEITEVHVDLENKIISAPCYMLDCDLYDIRLNTKQAVDKLYYFIKNND